MDELKLSEGRRSILHCVANHFCGLGVASLFHRTGQFPIEDLLVFYSVLEEMLVRISVLVDQLYCVLQMFRP